MKIFQIKIKNIISIICLIAVCFPLTGDAQHFGHGGGGGGGARGGGGGGAVRGGGGDRGGGFHPATINGGSRNVGNHIFGGANRNPRPVITVHNNENAFHHAGGGFHPYVSHPYHPYVWGPRWHPFGFFLGTLTADAIMLSIAGNPYYYDDGVYYAPYNGGYQAVAPPIGAVVSYLPAGFETIPLGDDTYYYYGGVFYVSQGGSYRVVPAPVGAVVYELPDGATDQNVNGQDYLLYNNTYYQPISSDGQDAYEVVQVN